MIKPTDIFDFHDALQQENIQEVERLIPLVSDSHAAFMEAFHAARNGKLNILQILLPRTSLQPNSFLIEASAFQQQEVFDFLYPMSDPYEALKDMNKRQSDALQRNETVSPYILDQASQMLRQRIKMDEEKAILLSEVFDNDNIQRQKKM